MKTGFIESFDKRKIWLYVWDNVKKPKAIVQIFHGMAEHAGRYEEFAKMLNTKGYIVVADDHRGHGKTAGSVENIGKYDGSNIFYDTMHDEMFITKLITEEYKLPVFVFGHSYGSFIAQGYIELISQPISGVILCGSACMKDRIDIFLGRKIAKATMKHKGPDAPAKLVAKMSFGAYDRKVKKGSWLNTDEEEVKKYYADEYCGKTLSAKFYYNFFKALPRIYIKKNLKKIQKNLPILIISGKQDPVGDMGKSVAKLFKLYNHLEMDVRMRLYNDARHEILNEPIKNEVYNSILTFLEGYIVKESLGEKEFERALRISETCKKRKWKLYTQRKIAEKVTTAEDKLELLGKIEKILKTKDEEDFLNKLEEL